MVHTSSAFYEGSQALQHRPSIMSSVQKMSITDSWKDSDRRKPK